MPLSYVAEQVCQKRYYRKDEDGNSIEDWKTLTNRVVNYVCQKEDDKFKSKAFQLLFNTEFLPNSPCLVNSGTRVGGLLACFVSKPPEDSWEDMCRNVAYFGYIARRGGGCGVDFSLIRPAGDPVFGSTHAKACGPIEHMRVVSEAMSSITQAGFRGMANMGCMRVNHPDILDFIVCKQRSRALKTMLKEDIFNHFEKMEGNTDDQTNIILDKFISNFNISVFATDDFMQRVEKDEDFDLTFGNKVYKTMKARRLFDMIIDNAWANGDPGMLFYDAINNGPYKYSGQEVTASNPCGEQILPELGSCNLGSIDVSKFYDKDTNSIDWKRLRGAIQTAVQFLDNVIDINKFPTAEFTKWAKENRPVGLGIMGWADLLLNMRIAYGSRRSVELADEMGSFFEKEAHKKSVALAKDRGTPKCCRYDELDHRRNVTTISIAPTGSIALIAGCSHSAEPIFSPVTFRYDNTGQYEMAHEYASKSYFRSALNPENRKQEVSWKEHIDMQSVFQSHCDSGISKTINMSNSATIQDVRDAYMRAWKKGCKGVTIYRDGSKTTQVLNTDKKVSNRNIPTRPKVIDADIFRTVANGREWHVMIGTVKGAPYELFAVNGRHDLPSHGRIIKKKKRHYSLVDQDDNILIDNIAQEEDEIHPQIGLETRRFSLELRHGIPVPYICDQIDKSNDVVTSFSKAVSRIFKRYIPQDQISESVLCPECAKNGESAEMVNEAGCLSCKRCHFSKCG